MGGVNEILMQVRGMTQAWATVQSMAAHVINYDHPWSEGALSASAKQVTAGGLWGPESPQ